MESIHKSYYFHKEAARKAHRGTINANYMFTVPIFPKLCPVYSTLEVSNVALRCVIEGVCLNQGGHGTGKTGNLVLTFSRQGKHREIGSDTGKIFGTVIINIKNIKSKFIFLNFKSF